MVIRDELAGYLSYQKYLIGKNEAWRREPRGLLFDFDKTSLDEIVKGETLITQGGRAKQLSEYLVYDIKNQVVSPVWQDEFLYQAMGKVPYDLRFELSGELTWVDESCEKSTYLKCLCVVESNKKAYMSQFLKGSGLRILDIIIKPGGYLRHDVYLDSGEYDYINVYVEDYGTYEAVFGITQSNRRAIRVLLMGEGAKAKISGCIVSNNVCKEQVLIEHYGKKTESKHLVKTLCNERVDVVSQVVVHKTAKHAKSQQSIQHLLLTKHAKAFSKPALDISVDDVACEHGATMSMIEDGLLFYMLSRGLSPIDAKKLYIDGFIESAYAAYPDVLMNMKGYIQRAL